jgi:signal transduction histidine kinase
MPSAEFASMARPGNNSLDLNQMDSTLHKTLVGGGVYSRGFAFDVFAWAIGIGLLMSTEFLAQPFVWRGWPVSVVLIGWLHIALDRLLVACSIAAFVVVARRVLPRNRMLQMLMFTAAVVAGAILGESLRIGVDPFATQLGIEAAIGHFVQWTLVGLTMAGILACWRLNADYTTTAARAVAAGSRARRMLVALELDALQRQIEPHFLFNTLATIKRFGQTAPADGYALLERLFNYLSTTITASQKNESSLGAELDLVQAYLDVCAVRMGHRLTVISNIDPTLRACRFPPLMLGTLVENAIRHGLAPVADGGTIKLSAERKGAILQVCVCDNGIGLVGDGGSGIGLANLSARLKLLYDREASLRLEVIEPHGVSACLRIPHALAI